MEYTCTHRATTATMTATTALSWSARRSSVTRPAPVGTGPSSAMPVIARPDAVTASSPSAAARAPAVPATPRAADAERAVRGTSPPASAAGAGSSTTSRALQARPLTWRSRGGPRRSRGRLGRRHDVARLGQVAGTAQVDVPAPPEQQQHDGERHAHLGGRDRDDEEGEDLPGVQRVRVGGVEGDQQQVRGVQDQLDADQHEHGVAPGQHAVDPGPGERRGQQQRTEQVHQPSSPRRGPAPSRDSTSAATRAASSSSESSSKGSTQSPNSERARGWARDRSGSTWSSRPRMAPTSTTASRPVVAAPATAAATRCGQGASTSGDLPIGARASMSANSTSTTTAPTYTSTWTSATTSAPRTR